MTTCNLTLKLNVNLFSDMPTVELIATHVTNRLRTASGHVAMQGVNTRTAAAGNGIPATGREPDPHLILLHDLSLV